ncbi:L-asparaginase [Undibacterium sp. CY21W]|uniref:L-asparaginase n=1 Tax=Undibacterium sp. CY21W TaxID=2762293 RepID=UPI0021023AEF|nr:L-asparaginase [Undibacterium sp. CY21W]
MKTIAPGTVIFHRHRGYGVLTTVNLLTGWVAARFGDEKRTLDLNLSTDDIQHADGSAILFRRDPPERMPQARLMAMVRELHAAGYQKLYLYIWPKASGLHWRWQLFTGTRNWMQRPCREGWYGSGADYIFNPVMGWGDAPGASSAELSQALAQFDPAGLAQALGRDEDHSAWFADVCDALLPDYAYSLGADTADNPLPLYLPVIGVRQRQPALERQLPYPPGWERTWSPDSLARRHQQRAVVRHDVIPSGWSLPIDF